MTDLEQKKFYSNGTTNKTIEAYAQEKGVGFSEALRLIINEWAEMRKEHVRVPIVGKVK